jgi:homoserine kinase
VTSVTIESPASIANFGPGFDIFALALERPFDVLNIRLNDKRSIGISITGRGDSLPTAAEKNTAGLAALRFFERLGQPPGADIEIVKSMPVGSGLGSSAASAAAAVYGLNRLLGAGLSEIEMIELASEGEAASGGTPHADNVAGCLLGGFVFVRSYDPLDVVRLDTPAISVVAGVLRKSRTTTRGLIAGQFSLAQVKEQMSWCSDLILAVLTRDIRKIGRAINRDHISEPARSRFIPGYDDLKRILLADGALGFNVSGGGSSVFAVCEEAEAERVRDAMTAFYKERGIPAETVLTRASNRGLREIHDL